jgi:hypothetical protein
MNFIGIKMYGKTIKIINAVTLFLYKNNLMNTSISCFSFPAILIYNCECAVKINFEIWRRVQDYILCSK